MEAARLLREQIADIAAGDADFIRDTIEGETSLHEQIGALAASIAEDEAVADGIKALLDNLGARKKRLEARADVKRALVACAMEIGELRKIDTPAGTVSLKPVPPKLIPTEESDIPARFWKVGDPILDRKALGDALKARDAALKEAQAVEDQEVRALAIAAVEAAHPPIPGATLSNGSLTISIRSK
jgi:hypothetical protein